MLSGVHALSVFRSILNISSSPNAFSFPRRLYVLLKEYLLLSSQLGIKGNSAVCPIDDVFRYQTFLLQAFLESCIEA